MNPSETRAKLRKIERRYLDALREDGNGAICFNEMLEAAEDLLEENEELRKQATLLLGTRNYYASENARLRAGIEEAKAKLANPNSEMTTLQCNVAAQSVFESTLKPKESTL